MKKFPTKKITRSSKVTKMIREKATIATKSINGGINSPMIDKKTTIGHNNHKHFQEVKFARDFSFNLFMTMYINY